MNEDFLGAQRSHAAGEIFGALETYRRLLRSNPSHPELLHFSGLALYQLQNQEQGLHEIRRSICVAPSIAVFWSNFAKTLSERGDRDRAILFCSRALNIDGAQRDAAFNRANLLRLQGSLAQSVHRYWQTISVHPADFEIYLNLGVCERQRGHHRAAVRAYERCLALKPDDADAEFSMSLCLLSLGEFRRGWLAYRSRFQAKVNEAHGRATLRLRGSRPTYVGTQHRRVLVWGEQGVGDEIMFGSLIGEFRPTCSDLFVQVDPRLKGLYRRAFPGLPLLDRGSAVDPERYDEQIGIGDLAFYLRDSVQSFARHRGHYLSADSDRCARYRARMNLAPGEIVIGLSWKSIAPETGVERSLSLSTLLAAMTPAVKVRYVNLQYGTVSTEIDQAIADTGIKVWTEPEVDNRDDLDGLAALIAACDMVVTIGNTTAHLAGALGKKTVVLLPFVAGWRWMNAGETCLWYESLTLLRQSRAGDWGSVLSRLREEVSNQLTSLLRAPCTGLDP